MPVPTLRFHFARATRHRLTRTVMPDKVNANDLFYWPPGHNVKVDEDAEIVMFSPQHEHSHVINHMIAKVSA